MPTQSSLQILAILSPVPLALAGNYAYGALTAGVTYSGDGWAPTCIQGPAACWDGCSSLFAFGESKTPQTYTYTFAVPSTRWLWYGFKAPTGSAKVCFDGATTGCDTVVYSDSSASIGADPPVLLYSKTALTNAIHTVTITNIPDTTGSTGTLSIDHMEIDGGVPHFPSDTFVTSSPMLENELYRVDMHFGDTVGESDVLIDSGSGAGAMWWIGCTEPECAGHNPYIPSSAMVNTSQSDVICYGSGDNCFWGWRVNDTMTFGTVTTTASWDALYSSSFPQTGDANMGAGKTYWFQGQCNSYHSFTELAYANGDIKAPVAAFYQLTSKDSPASGVVSVAQIGGVDQNKYTGAIDWVPMSPSGFWISPSQVRTARATTGGPVISVTNNIPLVMFDTGTGGVASIPDVDFDPLAAALDAIQDSDGNWWWPCEATITFMPKGTQNREYTFNIADPTVPFDGQAGYCGSRVGNAIGGGVWLMGQDFLSDYYVVLEFRANLMGFATKNVGASAATVNPLQQ